MPAWSVPGSQQALSPAIRRQRVSTSWIVLFSAWPRCSGAVTLGGGMTIAYGLPGSPGSAWKSPAPIHVRYASDSTAAGLYALLGCGCDGCGGCWVSAVLMGAVSDRKSEISDRRFRSRVVRFSGAGIL